MPGGNGKQRVSHTFDTMAEAEVQLWIAKAQQFVGRQSWTYDEFDYPELCYTTAVYLHHVAGLLKSQRQFPCYVVHNADDDSRFESGSHEIALGHYKRLSRHCRVALFHWPNRDGHKRLYASEGYPYSYDYGPRED